ncbi:hypothetical protein K438DRAFT_1771387 [Mycena galopus ATCC 62051]|nr:hypothetical protein K438DRAFT_1771387 [Mycena galopus ATCC 62051]
MSSETSPRAKSNRNVLPSARAADKNNTEGLSAVQEQALANLLQLNHHQHSGGFARSFRRISCQMRCQIHEPDTLCAQEGSDTGCAPDGHGSDADIVITPPPKIPSKRARSASSVDDNSDNSAGKKKKKPKNVKKKAPESVALDPDRMIYEPSVALILRRSLLVGWATALDRSPLAIGRSFERALSVGFNGHIKRRLVMDDDIAQHVKGLLKPDQSCDGAFKPRGNL